MKKELRIGNRVNCKLTEHPIEVGEVLREGIRNNDTIFPYDDLSGIPITEEWLLQSGCTKSETFDAYWHCGRIIFFFDKQHNRVMIEIGGSCRYYNWVHEFQNVMELAGQELKIKFETPVEGCGYMHITWNTEI